MNYFSCSGVPRRAAFDVRNRQKKWNGSCLQSWCKPDATSLPLAVQDWKTTGDLLLCSLYVDFLHRKLNKHFEMGSDEIIISVSSQRNQNIITLMWNFFCDVILILNIFVRLFRFFFCDDFIHPLWNDYGFASWCFL